MNTEQLVPMMHSARILRLCFVWLTVQIQV
jgi:hypothetical protein